MISGIVLCFILLYFSLNYVFGEVVIFLIVSFVCMIWCCYFFRVVIFEIILLIRINWKLLIFCFGVKEYFCGCFGKWFCFIKLWMIWWIYMLIFCWILKFKNRFIWIIKLVFIIFIWYFFVYGLFVIFIWIN